jgi:dihydrofolate synthase/folylpolyglutamate synthase
VNYQEAVNYILSFTNWEQAPAVAYEARKFDLRRMRSFLARLGDPQRGRRTVHIAGSKGKGSMAAMAASVLRAAGFKTGLYTSPHLHSFRERIVFDGEPIPEDDFARLTEEMVPHAATENESARFGTVTTFELLTTLAFLYFRDRGAEWQVLEVGLGGRLDATNVVDDKDVCIICPIELEHAAILGDTPAKIAAEKAAIIQKGNAAIMGVQPYSEAAAVIRQAAVKAGAEFVDVAAIYRWQLLEPDTAGQSFRLEGPNGVRELRLPLLGRHQLENAAAVVAAIEALQARDVAISEDALASGLAATHWPGRLEVVGREPWIVLDGAHTPEAALRLRQALEEYFTFQKAIFIVGFSNDKDLHSIASALKPIAWRAIATQSGHPRALAPEAVAEAFEEQGIAVNSVADVAEAVEAARAVAGPQDLICVLGSIFVAAEAREHLLGLTATV